MKLRLILHKSVDRDLDDIAYYLSQRSSAAAARFIGDALAVIESLSMNPGRGPVVESLRADRTLRRVVLPHFDKYLLYYFVSDDAVTVFRVLHSSRDVSSILKDAIDS